MGATIRGSSGVRLAMQLIMASAAIWWLLFWFIQPITTANVWMGKVNAKDDSQFQGMNGGLGTAENGMTAARGSLFLLQAIPIIVIAILSFFVLELRRRLLKPTAKVMVDGRKPRIEPWALPVFIRSPFFGMLTVGDLTFILVISFIVLWYFIKSTVKIVHEINTAPREQLDYSRSVEKVYQIGVLFGRTAVIPIALLWLPVSRGSAILQVIGVPYERAVKYHNWLGYLTVWLLLFHGWLIIGYYIGGHKKEVITWPVTWYPERQGDSVMAGVVSLTAGVIMLITAIGWVRRKFFDLFFVSHQLYLVFLIFFWLHVVNSLLYVIVPVLIFFLDRFMRAVQSRKSVDVLSAKVYSSGIIELKFAKPATSTYHALSFVYVLLPSVSRLHWHPFSVVSSPLDGTNEIAIYIKPLGEFTKNLHDVLISSKSTKSGRDFYKCPFSCKIGLEGAYGDESAFYLRYKNLVMVAGGIGVTPFLALLRDILHRYRLQQEDLPTSVMLIFCVKDASELHILDALTPSSILPGYEERFTIKIEAYVTTKSASAHDDSTVLASTRTNSTTGQEMNFINIHKSIVEVSLNSPEEFAREMSPISSSGSAMWVGATTAATMIGFFVINGVFNITALKKNNLTSYDRVFITITGIIFAVVVCGGGTMLVWSFFEKRARRAHPRMTAKASRVHSPARKKEMKDIETSVPADDLWQGNVTYGRRPNWKDFFSNMAITHDGQEVGVLVSGGLQMQEDVASECRHHSFSRASSVVMHYHSVSFEL